MNKSTRIEIYDTTLRDGTQAQGVSLSLQEKLLIADALDGLGLDYIEGGYPLSNPKDEQFFVEAARRNFKHAKVAAFGMTRRKNIAASDDDGMKALIRSEAPIVTIVGKTWDLHVREVLQVSPDENLRMIADSIAVIAKAGRRAFYDAEHFFDGYLANPEYAVKTLQAARDAGAECLILCDTNGGRLPEEIASAIDAVRAALGNAVLGIHCHNDGGLAVASTLAGVRHGVTHVQGTINGIGERCGNADLTAVIANLAVKYGYSLLQDNTLRHLTETSRYVYEVANLNFQENQPFVGASAFAHKGGMHVHAIQRNTTTYEHMDPKVVGNDRRILVSELSGISNIAAKADVKYGLKDNKDRQRLVLKSLMELENAGYQFEAAEASFDVLIRRTLGGKWYSAPAQEVEGGARTCLWNLDHYRCVISKRGSEAAGTEATVKIVINGRAEHTVAEGDGPVDSLRKALSAALRYHFPRVDDLHLVDYKVRVVNTAAESAAKVRVVIDWRDASNESLFGTVGVSENIVDASWLALLDAMEYKVLTEQEKG